VNQMYQLIERYSVPTPPEDLAVFQVRTARIDFKIATVTYKTLSSGHPVHLRELISPYQPSHSLRSSNQLLLTVPCANLTVDQHVFSYSPPVIWNAIPLSVSPRPSVHSSVA